MFKFIKIKHFQNKNEPVQFAASQTILDCRLHFVYCLFQRGFNSIRTVNDYYSVHESLSKKITYCKPLYHQS